MKLVRRILVFAGFVGMRFVREEKLKRYGLEFAVTRIESAG